MKDAAALDRMPLADLIYERIKHGDEKHQQWLRDKSYEIAAEWNAAPQMPEAARPGVK